MRSADTVATFEASLRELDVGLTRTTPEGCEAAVADLVDGRGPVVGVEVPFEGATLPEAVDTDPTPADVHGAATGVTPATMGIAEYGSVLLESDEGGTEPLSVYPEFHVAVLETSALVPDAPAAFEALGPRFRGERTSVVFATGPSATADMGTLVVGAHGPAEVHVVLLEEDGVEVEVEVEAEAEVEAGDDDHGENDAEVTGA